MDISKYVRKGNIYTFLHQNFILLLLGLLIKIPLSLSEHQINTKYINDVVKSFRKRNPSMSVVYTKAFGLAIIIWMTLLFMRKMRFQALLTLTFLGSLQIYLVSRALYENVSFVSILDGIGNGLACVECFALLMLLLNKK